MDMDPDDPVVLSNIFVEMGIEQKDIDDLSVGEMSKIIESLSSVVSKIKDDMQNVDISGIKETETDADKDTVKQ